MRRRFKTNLICSSDNYELTIRIHRKYYSDRWDLLYEEISLCKPYYYFLGRKIMIRTQYKMNELMNKGFKIHFE